MLKILENAKILVCVGSGGVGKTTSAAALGFLAAQRGRRVLVLTIDPSKRLKTTLGLKDDGRIASISHPKITGSLAAAVIDAKRTFDDFVIHAAKNEELIQKILTNKLYVQLTTTLSGSQEFTALEKLYSCYETGQYDLIVLDTPPTKHAIDFLLAPQKLAALFNESVAKWFRQADTQSTGFLRNIIHKGARQALHTLEIMTGSEFMHELSEFFKYIEAWQSKLDERVTTVHQLLINPQTHFCLITSFDKAKLQEAEYFGREIRKGGYQLSGVLINRAYPLWLRNNTTKDQAQTTTSSALVELYTKMKRYYINKNVQYSSFAHRMTKLCSVHELPEFDEDVSELNGVIQIAEQLPDVLSKGIAE